MRYQLICARTSISSRLMKELGLESYCERSWRLSQAIIKVYSLCFVIVLTHSSKMDWQSKQTLRQTDVSGWICDEQQRRHSAWYLEALVRVQGSSFDSTIRYKLLMVETPWPEGSIHHSKDLRYDLRQKQNIVQNLVATRIWHWNLRFLSHSIER